MQRVEEKQYLISKSRLKCSIIRRNRFLRNENLKLHATDSFHFHVIAALYFFTHDIIDNLDHVTKRIQHRFGNHKDVNMIHEAWV